jgi:hypothetical protein
MAWIGKTRALLQGVFMDGQGANCARCTRLGKLYRLRDCVNNALRMGGLGVACHTGGAKTAVQNWQTIAIGGKGGTCLRYFDNRCAMPVEMIRIPNDKKRNRAPQFMPRFCGNLWANPRRLPTAERNGAGRARTHGISPNHG